MGQALAAADRLATSCLAAVVCSPSERARFGAEAICRGRGGASVRIETGLREVDRGDWAGRTRAEILRDRPGEIQAEAAALETWNGHGGESMGEMRLRVLEVRDRLLAEFREDQSIVIVSHLWPTRAILADALGMPVSEWARIDVPLGSISLVEFGAAGARVPWLGRTEQTAAALREV